MEQRPKSPSQKTIQEENKEKSSEKILKFDGDNLVVDTEKTSKLVGSTKKYEPTTIIEPKKEPATIISPVNSIDNKKTPEIVEVEKKSTKKSKETRGFPELKKLEKEIRELNEKYFSSIQKEKKADLYNQLTEAQKEYRKLEESLDTQPQPSEKETKINRLQALKEKICELNEKYFSSIQREEKALLYSELEEAQKEYRKLEEELDGVSTEENKKTEEKKEGVVVEGLEFHGEEKTKTPEEINWKEKYFDLLEKIKTRDLTAIALLIALLTEKTGYKVAWFTEEELVFQRRLLVLLEEAKGGDVMMVNFVITFITHQEVTIVVNPRTPEPVIPPPENIDGLRDAYLKAKRLRGNVFRGFFGGLFGRKLDFNGEKMKFGGKKGAEELERVRKEYQEGLNRNRTAELARLQASLEARVMRGEITPQDAVDQMRTRIFDLLSEEQGNIDKKSVEGIEKNLFEKMKTKWRQYWGKRLLLGGALLGASVLTAGTATGAALVGTRAVMGGIGTYIGVESGLERWSKVVGHKGLINDLNKAKFINDDSMYAHISTLSPEVVREEAARLRMLQVEKGLSMDGIDKRKIASMIIRRDNELTAQEVVNSTLSGDRTLNFADALSRNLSRQENAKNETVEKEVDKERLKKMIRKTTAVLAGGTVGWLIGGKLFNQAEATEGPVATPDGPVTTPPVDTTPTETLYTVKPGDSTWKIIEADLDSHGSMFGLGEAGRTHMIDNFKDMFAKISPDNLKALGFSSGDINVLSPGDTLNLSGILNDPSKLMNALSKAQGLSTEQISSIVNNNSKIASWFAEHHHEFKGIFNDSVIEKILKGTKVF